MSAKATNLKELAAIVDGFNINRAEEAQFKNLMPLLAFQTESDEVNMVGLDPQFFQNEEMMRKFKEFARAQLEDHGAIRYVLCTMGNKAVYENGKPTPGSEIYWMGGADKCAEERIRLFREVVRGEAGNVIGLKKDSEVEFMPYREELEFMSNLFLET
jgi:hypothetical protein